MVFKVKTTAIGDVTWNNPEIGKPAAVLHVTGDRQVGKTAQLIIFYGGGSVLFGSDVCGISVDMHIVDNYLHPARVILTHE